MTRKRAQSLFEYTTFCFYHKHTHTYTCTHTHGTQPWTPPWVPSLPSVCTSEAYQCISIHEDTFGELCQPPAVQLREGDAQVWPGQQCKIGSVATVHHINSLHQVKHTTQLLPAGKTFMGGWKPIQHCFLPSEHISLGNKRCKGVTACKLRRLAEKTVSRCAHSKSQLIQGTFGVVPHCLCDTRRYHDDQFACCCHIPQGVRPDQGSQRIRVIGGQGHESLRLHWNAPINNGGWTTHDTACYLYATIIEVSTMHFSWYPSVQSFYFSQDGSDYQEQLQPNIFNEIIIMNKPVTCFAWASRLQELMLWSTVP